VATGREFGDVLRGGHASAMRSLPAARQIHRAIAAMPNAKPRIWALPRTNCFPSSPRIAPASDLDYLSDSSGVR
jgi:hypothetical protein